jgi:thioredoxin-like negative regulator of GroEL
MADLLATFVKPTLIEVMTAHCVECRAMQPDLDAVAKEHRGSVDLVVLDATEEPDRVAALRVFGTPTLIAVKSGAEVARITGRRSRSELRDLFAAVAAGDASAISAVSRSDRLVWSVAGVLLIGAGLMSGPSWFLVAVGSGLAAYALLRSGAG